MKTILVPVDFSEYSEYALEVAASIARRQNSKIVVLHMLGWSESVLIKNEEHQAPHYRQIAKDRFKSFLKKEYLKNIPVVVTIRNDKLFREINEISKEYKSSLIVMGSQGSSGIKEFFIGSNTEKVIRWSETPVLVIKKRIKDFNIKKAVIAFDFDLEGIKTFKEALNFLKNFNCEPALLYVNLVQNFLSTIDMRARVHNFFEEAGMEDMGIQDKVVYYNDYSLEKGILNFSRETGSDAIVILTHGHKGIAYQFFGSVGEEIANHFVIPVLTFKIHTSDRSNDN
ncbi:universal stress protein [Christiangramia sediminis]|uniref:Universal stress protein n=1 Tax=Christiangramia sediminis TaxID=2881336 RepID=A0A9X1RXN7_9FLAO|nr:universal stress protein [Christiangramia sediminis]MCB7481039.1 universal stress protein [Christiangramia sediminis]